MWPLQRDCAKFYGDPRGSNGAASSRWERENLITVPCPWALTYAGRPVKGIRVHRKVAESLTRALANIWERVGQSQAEIDRIGMSVYGGGYNFRVMRGGSSLSMHAYGAAVDFDPGRNALGDATPAMDPRVIEEFEREGWEWGGHWSRPDGMHFQAAWTREVPPRLGTAPRPPAKPATKRSEPDAEVERLQARLTDLGYYEVGKVDGAWGSRTRGALLAFKADAGLPLTADVDDAVWAALAKAPRRAVAPERAEATAAPSTAAKAGRAAEIAGGAAIGLGAADTALRPVGGISGALDGLAGAGEAAGKVRDALAPIGDLIAAAASNWPILLAAVGIGLFFLGRRIFRDELQSFRRGEWT